MIIFFFFFCLNQNDGGFYYFYIFSRSAYKLPNSNHDNFLFRKIPTVTWPFQHGSLGPSHMSLFSCVQKMKKVLSFEHQDWQTSVKKRDWQTSNPSLSLSLNLKWFG